MALPSLDFDYQGWDRDIMTKKEKKTIKFQLVTIHSAVEMEIEEGDYHNLFVGSNPDPYLQIKVVSPELVQLVVNPAKFPGYEKNKF